MNSPSRRRLLLPEYPARSPEIAVLLGMLEDSRRRTLDVCEDLSAGAFAARPAGHRHSIGDLLYHIAFIEADWLYVDVLETPMPPAIAALLPHPDRDADARLSLTGPESPAAHRYRLESVRRELVLTLQNLPGEELRRARRFPDRDVTPLWVIHHLLQHEAEHRAQIRAVKRALS